MYTNRKIFKSLKSSSYEGLTNALADYTVEQIKEKFDIVIMASEKTIAERPFLYCVQESPLKLEWYWDSDDFDSYKSMKFVNGPLQIPVIYDRMAYTEVVIYRKNTSELFGLSKTKDYPSYWNF